MDWLAEHWIHLIFLALYLGILVVHGWIGRSHVKGLDDYLVAGRRLGGGILAFSFYATFMSTNTFIGAAGKSWDAGLIWCIGGLVQAALCCVSWFVLAPRFTPLTRKYNSLTVADFLGRHYNSPELRRIAGGIICFASIAYLVAIYRGAALALVGLLDLPYFWAVAAIFAIVTAYTLAGGFESVVLTDSLQGVLMVVGAVAMAGAIVWVGGGLGPMLHKLHDIDPKLTSWQGDMPLATILALNLSVGLKYLVEPRQLSRFYGLKDNAALWRAAIIAPILVIVTYVCLFPLGALAHVLLPADVVQSSDEVVPALLTSGELFGPMLGVLFVLVLISAAMSSIDSVLLVAASSVEHDVLSQGGKDRAVRRTRIWVVAISLASVAVAISPMAEDIMSITAFSGALYSACFLPALAVGLFWRRPAAPAALASVMAGAVVVLGWAAARNAKLVPLHEVYPGLLAGLGVYSVVGLLGRRRFAKEVVKR
jgi:SSS family transporter